MSTRRPRSVKAKALLLVLGAAALGGGAWAVRPRAVGPRALPDAFKAAYPAATAPAGAGGVGAGASFAGVELARLGAAFQAFGLHETARDAYAPDDGGLVLSFSDPAGDVRAVVTLAVADTSDAARSFVTGRLLGVSTGLPAAADPALGDIAYADGGRGDGIVVGARGNVGYSVRVLPDDNGRTVAPASQLARAVIAALVAGTPAAWGATLGLPAAVSATDGSPVRVAAPAGATPLLSAEGAYVAHGSTGPVLRPFGPGPVAVTATVVDGLGRVSVTRAASVAR